MALISKSCEYGLRASLYVAACRGGDFVPIREIAKELNISFHFLTKILQKLTQHGILNSYRGPNGGVALAKKTGDISLLDIVRAIEEKDVFSTCVLGLAGCGDKSPCPLHKEWAAERTRLEKVFKSATLAKLADPVARGQLRISDR